MITTERLENLRKEAEARRNDLVSLLHQANGTISLLDLLIIEAKNSDQNKTD